MRSASSGAARTPALRKKADLQEYKPPPATIAQTPRAVSHVKSSGLGLTTRKGSTPARNGLGPGLGHAQTLAQKLNKASVVDTPSTRLEPPTGGVSGRTIPATPTLLGPGIPGDSNRLTRIMELTVPKEDGDIRGEESSTVSLAGSSSRPSSSTPRARGGFDNLPLPAILGKDRRSPVVRLTLHYTCIALMKIVCVCLAEREKAVHSSGRLGGRRRRVTF